jgi:hypothetical protein
MVWNPADRKRPTAFTPTRPTTFGASAAGPGPNPDKPVAGLAPTGCVSCVEQPARTNETRAVPRMHVSLTTVRRVQDRAGSIRPFSRTLIGRCVRGQRQMRSLVHARSTGPTQAEPRRQRVALRPRLRRGSAEIPGRRSRPARRAKRAKRARRDAAQDRRGASSKSPGPRESVLHTSACATRSRVTDFRPT